MISVNSFTFNPFQENTYILSDETGQCIIIDPGCHGNAEEQRLKSFISEKKLTPVKLVNTHCHVDHVFGNYFIEKEYGLKPWIHKLDLFILERLTDVATMYGVKAIPSPEPEGFFDEGDKITFGDSQLDIFFTPGHSPGSVVFYSKNDKLLIAGDVLFYESIGRTDLPGGDHETLLMSLREKVLVLDDDTVVYSGHGPSTTIGHEKKFNPFL